MRAVKAQRWRFSHKRPARGTTPCSILLMTYGFNDTARSGVLVWMRALVGL